jgi:hypothetical protein
MVASAGAGGLRGHFDRASQFDDLQHRFERAHVGVVDAQRVDAGLARSRTRRCPARFHEAFVLEPRDGLADHGTAHAELLGQHGLGGQLGAAANMPSSIFRAVVRQRCRSARGRNLWNIVITSSGSQVIIQISRKDGRVIPMALRHLIGNRTTQRGALMLPRNTRLISGSSNRSSPCPYPCQPPPPYLVCLWEEARERAGHRYAVFVEEQGVPVELEWDEMDAPSWHALAFAVDGVPVATGRPLPDGTLAAWRWRPRVAPAWARRCSTR